MIAQRALELTAQRIPFVSARVVLAERPTSAKPGDQALVLADGTIEGFVGGACAESTVRAQALALLDSGETLLLRISPTREEGQAEPGSADTDAPGRKSVHNPCLSGGTMEIFLEPVRPAPLVVIVGDTPIAQSLRSLALAMGYEVAPGIDVTDATAVVIASHGRDEEDVLRAALNTAVEYIGLVASPKRGAAVLDSLDMCTSHTSRVRTPAGLAIGATSPEEIAISILAEIVSVRPRPIGRPVAETSEASTGTAIDPVCSMTVAMVESSLHFDHEGKRSWFCGSGCLRAFAASPGDYAV